MSQDVLAAIEHNLSTFSKGQKLIGRYMLENYDKAAFMTASKLGKTVNVSESTVVRFAVELGFDGYPTMQKALQSRIRNKLTSVQRIEVANNRMGNQDVLKSVMHSDIDQIRATMEGTNRNTFSEVVDTILNSKRIFILGVRSSAPLAEFLGFYFNLVFDNVVVVHTTSTSEIFEKLVRVNEDDVVIGISFPRYSSRTVKAMNFARGRGAKVVALTDSENSPLVKCSHISLFAKSDMASFVDSLVAPMSMINALIVAVGRCRSEQVSRTFADLEQIWTEYHVYEQIGDSEEN